MKNKHFYTPKTSGDDTLKNPPKEDLKKQKSIESQKKDVSPKSTAMQTTETHEKKFQNGFQNKFFNPMQVQFESPASHTPTPTKVEFGNIFTEEELSDISGDMENFEKKFPQEIIEKYSKKSKTIIN